MWFKGQGVDVMVKDLLKKLNKQSFWNTEDLSDIGKKYLSLTMLI